MVARFRKINLALPLPPVCRAGRRGPSGTPNPGQPLALVAYTSPSTKAPPVDSLRAPDFRTGTLRGTGGARRPASRSRVTGAGPTRELKAKRLTRPAINPLFCCEVHVSKLKWRRC